MIRYYQKREVNHMKKKYDYISLFGIYEDLLEKEQSAFRKYCDSLDNKDFEAYSEAHQATRKVYWKILNFVSVADLVFSGTASLEIGQMIREDLDDQPIR